MMLMSEETRQALVHLLGEFFGHNSEADNLAYNLAIADYPIISDIYHHSFAHFFTGDEMADGISGIMDQLDARAVRLANPAHDIDYQGNLEAIFADNKAMCERCREAIITTIDLADMNGDPEVRIFAEELLMKFMPYYKQARVWDVFCKRYKDDWKGFEVHFEDITTFIPVAK